eukprot:TRINITY_DN54283_c0_g1_i2.p1 TRINITY_DN54283_c0_g1~~TRINITY_DN54283_c0_g1_i2.p1  ORF type:complete len:247 (-),score=18.03 TRINITY_DN54283_c0_g1_i2:30-770(-)
MYDGTPTLAHKETQTTNAKGQAVFQLNLSPTTTPRVTPCCMVLRKDSSQVWCNIFQVNAHTGVVVFDIGGTCTANVVEGKKEKGAALNGQEYDQQPFPFAAEVANFYHQKGYVIMYLTGRPVWITSTTEGWLRKHGFPPGIMRLTTAKEKCMGVPLYKSTVMEKLRNECDVQFAYAYTNEKSDLKAYYSVGMNSSSCFYVGLQDFMPYQFASYKNHLEEMYLKVQNNTAPGPQWPALPSPNTKRRF